MRYSIEEGTLPRQGGSLIQMQSQPASEGQFYEFGSFLLDLDEGVLSRDGQARHLPAKKFELLRLLVRHPGQVVLKDDIFRTVWPDRFIDESNLSQNILYLRQIIEENPQNPRYILTIPGAGYMFMPGGQSATVPAETTPLAMSSQSALPEEPPGEATTTVRATAPVTSPSLKENVKIRPDLWIKIALLLLALPVTGTIIWKMYNVDKRLVDPGLVMQPFITMNGRKGSLAFSPDGNSLAFTSTVSGSDSYSLYVRRMSDEKIVQLTNNASPSARISWSPDNRQIAFLRETVPGKPMQQILIIPAMGGSERLIGEARDGLDWSPDGQSLAIIDRSEPNAPLAVYVITVGEGTKRQLSMLPVGSDSYDRDPRFSPDGRSIAFVRQHTPFNCDIMLYELASGTEVKLAIDQADVRSLQWSADGRELLFLSRQSGASRIWSLPLRKEKPRAITTVSDTTDNFAISPLDGQLVISRLDITEKISILGRADGISGPLCEIKSTMRDFFPQFSNDGRQIAFVSDRTGFEEIWVTDPEYCYQTKLTNLEQRGVGRPRWSPDGKRIAFHRYVGKQTEVFLIEVIGGKLYQLTDHPAQDFNPAWSADGRWIYFTSRRQNSSSAMATGNHIWRVSADGGPATQVTVNNGFDSWESSDGKRLLFSNESKLYEKSLATGQELLINELGGERIEQNWTPVDGGVVVFNQQASRQSCVDFFDLESRQLRKVSCFNTVHHRPTVPRSLTGLSVSPQQKLIAFSLVYSQGGEISIGSRGR